MRKWFPKIIKYYFEYLIYYKILSHKGLRLLKKDSIHFDKLGVIETNMITYEKDLKISIDDLKEGYKKWLKEYMVN